MQNALFAGLAHTISSAAQHLSMNLTHLQNVLKKREKVNMSDDLEIVSKKALHKMLEMADRIEQLEAALRLARDVIDAENRNAHVHDTQWRKLCTFAVNTCNDALGEKKDD
jgi:acetylornithine/succinyldiaminopimelate/putrescine aminotransferase